MNAPSPDVVKQRFFRWEDFARNTRLWLSLLWQAMSRTGRGYKRHSLRHTGRRNADGEWDRRKDKIDGELAFMPKWFRSYSTRYAAPRIRQTRRQISRARRGMWS